MPDADFRCGRVAIIGRPNVGKSTLINALVNEHLSITSRKPQTTRVQVLGIVNRPDAQFILVDTPGFQQRHKTALTKRMNESVRASLHDVDVVLLVIDAARWTRDDERMLELLPRPEGGAAVVLVVNKTDRLARRELLLPLIADCATRYPFAAIVPVSAERGHQLEDLLGAIRPLMPPGEPLYEAELYTDRTVRFLAAELIREKAFRLLGDEIPYGIAVSIDAWEENDALSIAATLWVERDSQRGIVIGAGGAKLREIGRLARAEIMQLVDRPVHLATHVRVRRDWSNDRRALGELGYE
ncbi:MAG TPA: GTPase Era [Burkholderiaceae bacterium]|nr:GTPase Era [Burkholderiaceae bacterium]